MNALEAKRIVEKIAECLDRDPLPTVGVITPHTEQQAYIAKLVGEHPQSEEFYDKLRLKIMTSNTCQGGDAKSSSIRSSPPRKKIVSPMSFPASLTGTMRRR